MSTNPRKTTKGVGLGCLGVFALLWVLGTLAERNQNHWRPLQPSNLPTVEFRSPYPWVETVRRDGVQGYFVYALVDQVPSDWHHDRLVNQHNLGYWQFVLANRQPAPEDARFACQGGGIGNGPIDVNSFRCAIELMTTPDQSGPPDFTVTPAGQTALASIP
jgi:hypothetical protein